MKLVQRFRERMSGFLQVVQDENDSLVAQIQKFLDVEHLDDGTHATSVGGLVQRLAGQNIGAGQPVYISGGAGNKAVGQAFLADATNSYSSTQGAVIGLATKSVSAGENVVCRDEGILGGFAGLVPGTQYYVGTVPGSITTTAPTNAVSLGMAVSDTEMLLLLRNPQTIAGGTYSVDWLVVAGGGGGGTNTLGSGVLNTGGGGAGGFKTGTLSAATGTQYTITRGAAGAIGANGGDSSISGVQTCTGGGHGGAYNTIGVDGGSGGGNGGDKTGSTAGLGTSGQGNNGGNALSAGNTAGGGGGSSAAGSNTGTGGAGTSNSYSGAAVTYAAGGPGGQSGAGTSNPGDGGHGGQGDGGASGAGTAGIVIIRYAGSQRGTGGTVTSAGGFTIHTFTSNGVFTF